MVQQTIKIPEGTQSAAQFRLRNLGVPEVNGRGRGDCTFTSTFRCRRSFPKNSAGCLNSLAELLPAENAPHEKSVFEKVRDFFTQ